jgi:hypothetical protein
MYIQRYYADKEQRLQRPALCHIDLLQLCGIFTQEKDTTMPELGMNQGNFFLILNMICWEIVLLKSRHGRLNPQNMNKNGPVVFEKIVF